MAFSDISLACIRDDGLNDVLQDLSAWRENAQWRRNRAAEGKATDKEKSPKWRSFLRMSINPIIGITSND
ncbi:hypothetical protein DA792_07755 [Celeribacter baekdonensis]|uniref:Uncharacterized protein n=1 Tax=Celeribacter baekdonensis TaxID=875171 RepID=A0A2R4M1E8_9RHOB|nr:hypothetical protein DA792_07755 [Celeribacter baekdonensis]